MVVLVLVWFVLCYTCNPVGIVLVVAYMGETCELVVLGYSG
jgi:hypothetical protein